MPARTSHAPARAGCALSAVGITIATIITTTTTGRGWVSVRE